MQGHFTAANGVGRYAVVYALRIRHSKMIEKDPKHGINERVALCDDQPNNERIDDLNHITNNDTNT